MAPTNVELYEALRHTVGEDAARMIAEVVPPVGDVATKADLRSEIASLRDEIATLRNEMREGFAKVWEEFAKLRGEIKAESNNNLKWMLGFFIPVWAGTWATTIAVLVKL